MSRSDRKYQTYLDAFYQLASEGAEALEAVFERVTDGSRDLLVLQFTSKSLLFTTDPDNDTIGIDCCRPAPAHEPGLSRINSERPWKDLIGSEFGWGWVTINQQGYCDGALLSFDGITPSVILYVEASSLKVQRIPRQRAASLTPRNGGKG
jgi:hypothetical protein